MRYRRLGRTDLDVSEIGHGLWGMGGWSGSDDAESMRALQLSLENGCNFFDTAWAYGEGHSDRLLGALIKANPGSRIIAASKVPPLNRRWPGTAESTLQDTFPRAHVLDVADRIRAALGVETIDLLQYHVWDDAWTGDASFGDTIAELKEKGVIRWFGLSLNRWEPWNGLRALDTGVVDAVQVIYNIFDQAPSDVLYPKCVEHNVGVIARVPLDEGSLAGTLTKETRFPEGDWRAGYFGPENLPQTVDRVERLRPLVPAGMTMAELALRFAIAPPEVSTTIVGMRKDENVRMNTAISDDAPLSAELLAAMRAHRWDRKPKRWAD